MSDKNARARINPENYYTAIGGVDTSINTEFNVFYMYLSDKTEFEDTVWRYRDYPQFMWILQTEQLHFHRSDCFDDPFEGTVPEALHDIWKNNFADSTEEPERASRHYYEIIKHLRKSTFLNCWHVNSNESAAMWDAYSTAGKGIAIKSTVEDLVQIMQSSDYEKTGYGDVLYVDFDATYEEIDSCDIEKIEEVLGTLEGVALRGMDLFRLKRQEFSHEREFRTSLQFQELLWDNDRDYPFETTDADDIHIASKKPDTTHINISVDLDDLIDGVYLAPGTSDWVIESIEQAIDEKDNIELSSDDVVSSELRKDTVLDRV